MKTDNIQKKVADLYEQNGWNTDPTLLLVAMQEELGEVAGIYLAEHPDYKKSIRGTNPLPEELGDLLQLILAFCNKMNVDFEEVVLAAIEKREKQV